MHGSALIEAGRFYLRALAMVVVAGSAAVLVSMQAGWFSPAETAAAAPAAIEEEDAAEVVSATGQRRLWSGYIPVDPSLTYELSAEFRAIARDDGQPVTARTYLAVATYDGDREEIRSDRTVLRHAAASNYHLSSSRGWVTLSGQITGESEDGHNRFMPGTRFIRVVATINHGSEDVATEVRNIRFTPRLSMGSR